MSKAFDNSQLINGAPAPVDADTVDGLQASQFVRSDVKSSVQSDFKVIGTNAGSENFSTILFYESDGVTRKGFVGDSSSFDNSIYLGANAGDVILYAGGGVRLRAKASGGVDIDGLVGSFSANGYQKLPNGLIIQWGGGNNPESTTVSHTLPIAFPNACLRAFATGTSVSGDQAEVCIMDYNSTTVSTRTDVAQNVFWLAIGH